MSILTKEQIKALIAENKIITVEDISITLKDMFKDFIQEMLDAEFDEHLSYGKYDISGKKDDYARFFCTIKKPS